MRLRLRRRLGRRGRLAGAGLRLADGPALVGGGAGEPAAVGVVGRHQQRAAVALGERAFVQQVEHLVREVEQAHEVRDGDAGAADAAADVLARETQLVDEQRAGARLLERVEVLARHVLDQRDLERLAILVRLRRAPGSPRARRAAPRASGARRRSARTCRRAAGARSTGCRTPLLLERLSASATSATSSKAWRGWRGFLAISSTGTRRRSACASAPGSPVGDRIAARPRPMPRLRSATGGDLLRQLEVRLRPGAVRIVMDDRARRSSAPRRGGRCAG